MKSRVLIVEDNLIAYKVSQHFFQTIGCETDHVMTGEEATELFIQHASMRTPYAAIYMDLSLPKMNGFETYQAIRKYEKENNRRVVPIIAVTGNHEPDIASKCLEVGMVSVLPKPMTRDSLLDFERSMTMYHLRTLHDL